MTKQLCKNCKYLLETDGMLGIFCGVGGDNTKYDCPKYVKMSDRMTEREKYSVHDWVKFNYSEIGEYIGEEYTDKPLRNDEIVDLMNNFYNENKELIRGILMKEEVINDLKDDIRKCNIQCRKLGNENEWLKQQNDFLTTQLAELSTYMMALGYDIELEFEGGRVIKLNEELKGDVE